MILEYQHELSAREIRTRPSALYEAYRKAKLAIDQKIKDDELVSAGDATVTVIVSESVAE